MEHLGFFNISPFAAEQFMLADENGADLLVLVAKATYKIEGRDRLELGEPEPIDPVGSYHGDPDASSPKNVSEASFFKPSTDVALIGAAHAPGGKPKPSFDVSLRVGPVRKVVRVTGDRTWRKPWYWPFAWSASAPRPFTTMPLVYERAFGGIDQTPADKRKRARDPRNPVGTGLLAKGAKPKQAVPLPNLEDPSTPLKGPGQRPSPAGFGYIAPHWLWRLEHAGTYDAAWQEKRSPLLPRDFDRRFFNAAHPDLIAPEYLKGGETVEVVNASPRGKLVFSLPRERLEGVLMMKDQTRRGQDMNLDTVLVDTDAHKLQMVWRTSFPVYKQVQEILWAKVHRHTADGEGHGAA